MKNQNKCCEKCINEGSKGEWTGCCDMNCPCHKQDSWEKIRESFTEFEIGEIYLGVENRKKIADWWIEKLSQEYERGRGEERDRILKEGLELIKWNEDPKNHWAGLLHSNTTINAIRQILDRVRQPLTGQTHKDKEERII